MKHLALEKRVLSLRAQGERRYALPAVSKQLETCFPLLCGEENAVVASYFVMTECAEKELPRNPAGPARALGSPGQLGLSEVGVLRESRNSLPPQTVETSPFNCFKSCRELKIEAFWREERVLWGRFVCFGFFLPPWNAAKTWRSQLSNEGFAEKRNPFTPA